MTTPLAPRLAVVDALRGFALMGVVVSNTVALSGFVPSAHPELVGTLKDVIAFRGVLMVGIAGRFMGLFSLLFGIGFGLMLARTTARGESFAPRYLRRTAALFGFGVLSLLLGNGDVLHIYALLAVLLLAFRQASERTLIIAAVASLFVGGIASSLQPIFTEYLPSPRGLSAKEAVLHRTGDYGALVQFRVAHLWARIWPAFLGTNFLALFFAGVIIARSRLLEQLDERRRLLKRLMWGALALIVLSLAVTGPLTRVLGGWAPPLFMVGGVGFYFSVFLLLWRRGGRARRALATLIPAGRMALTWYLSVPIIAFFLFDLPGLYSKVPAFWGTLTGCAVFAAMLGSSHWWFTRFRIGPAEWLWRSITYGQRQLIRYMERYAGEFGGATGAVHS